ncbi:MAG: NHLP bacteriocin system secretion protein [Geminicoccaceae bacterium]
MAGIFRQTALDRASSPERLDETISIVSMRSWLLLLGLALIIAAGVLWGWFGSVPTRVYGQAIIVSEGSATHALKPLFAGRIVEVLAGRATSVKTGQELVHMRIPSLEQELRAAEELLEALSDAQLNMQARDAERKRTRDEAFAQQERALQQRIADGQRHIRTLESQLADLESLLGEGFTTRIRVNDAQEQLDAGRGALAQAQTDLAAVASERIRTDADDANRLDQLTQQMIDQNGRVKVLRDRLQEASTIESPIDGLIEEVDVSVGSVVAEGQVLMTIKTHSTGFEALSFVPAVQGNLVLPGMAAHLAPVGVKEEEFGTIRGKVQTVSDHPVSKRAAAELLQNDELVEAFFEDGPPIEVRVVLEADPNTASGFAWWAGKGPPFAVTAGTLGWVSVTVREQPPVTLVLPALRSLLGYY